MKYLFVLSLITISIFAFSPGQYTPAIIVNHDKAAHALAFFILSFLVHCSFRIIPIYKIMMLTITIGLAIELIQFLFTSRGFSLEDLMYDIVGVSIYVMIYFFIQLLQSSKKRYRDFF